MIFGFVCCVVEMMYIGVVWYDLDWFGMIFWLSLR